MGHVAVNVNGCVAAAGRTQSSALACARSPSKRMWARAKGAALTARASASSAAEVAASKAAVAAEVASSKAAVAKEVASCKAAVAAEMASSKAAVAKEVAASTAMNATEAAKRTTATAASTAAAAAGTVASVARGAAGKAMAEITELFEDTALEEGLGEALLAAPAYEGSEAQHWHQLANESYASDLSTSPYEEVAYEADRNLRCIGAFRGGVVEIGFRGTINEVRPRSRVTPKRPCARANRFCPWDSARRAPTASADSTIGRA